MSLARKGLEGFVFGLGLAVAMAIVHLAYIFWVVPTTLEQFVLDSWNEGEAGPNAKPVVSSAPELRLSSEYLGSSGSYSGRFSMGDYSILASGEGIIRGDVVSGTEPVEGLKIRLGLNGTVMTQWARSDPGGRYEIAVPPGEYRIDAFEIDAASAGEALGGKIQRPGRRLLGRTLSVAPDSPATGPRFEFVEPVEKIGPVGTVSAEDEIVLEWRPFPGATDYEVQVYAIPDPGEFSSVKALLPQMSRPRVSEPRMRLSDLGVNVEPGMGYRFSVTAYEDRRMISQSHESYSSPDFTVGE